MLSNRTSKSFFHSFLFAHTTKKGELPARGNQDRARSYQIALANLSFSLILSLLAQQKLEFQRKEMKIELGCYQIALANRSFILFSLLTQQTRWISST